MHLRLSPKIEAKLSYLRLKFLPRTLFFRTMLLIFVPLIVVQIVSVVVFFDGSWSRMGRKLSENLAAEIAIIIDMAEQKDIEWERVQKTAANVLGLSANKISATDKAKYLNLKNNKMVLGFLETELRKNFPSANPEVFLSADGDTLSILIHSEKAIYEFTCPKKRIFSSSIFMFVVWMAGTSVLLFLVAVLFLRIQVRAISDLAKAAEDFGKGVDNKRFKPYGSSEVRKAAIAFIRMKERIQRQISERTQMLAGISHDLRTPLTRMKLQISMMKEEYDKKDLLVDVDEMEKMLNGYLAFVRGEATEEYSDVNINLLLDDMVDKFRLANAKINYTYQHSDVVIVAREQSLRRAVGNIISNAAKYGKNIAISLNYFDKNIEIIVEDDGPGIPKDKRDDVFKAFYRLEKSRNKETGGVGLGLSITKDVITSHGGTIKLDDSSLGGLKVVINIPR
ncbi:MAG: two-component sensor histidine kinase [Alphaproteobacteria bacterium]|nr:two-component sensor histidine kinase [Alphaproteobacteria bacterium]